MKALSWVRARPKTAASIAGVAIGAVALTSMAVAYDGLPTTKVDLNDAGVWLTKSSSFLVGHFNHESTVLDGGMRAASEDYDVLQDGATVLVADKGESTLTAVDPARMVLGDSASVPGSAKVALGAKTVAILDDKSGDLWITSAKGLSGFDIKAADPTVELGKGADVTVGRDGTVYALSGEKGEVVTVPSDPEGMPLEPATASVGELDLSEPPSITAVGTTPVVLDAAAGVLTTPGGFRTELAQATDAVLQQASAESASVALSTPTSLLQVPLDGGDPVATDADGTGNPAAPVQLRGCTYGAWSISATFIRDCTGDSLDVKESIPGAENAESLTFRVNRDVIVLNDIIGGAAWLANESLQRVDDWSVLVPPEGESEDDENTSQETVETSLPERKEKNTPPTAEDDPDLGVRPGGTTLLPVLDNDNDPDGDVLVASLVGKQPSVGDVSPILNGAALQISVPEDATGTASFTYEIDDGRGGKDQATVTVSVHDEKTNGAPRPKRTSKMAVETGGTVSYNVLPDWRDPDGDDLYLRSVVAADGDEVEFTTDGKITYRAVASLQGRKEVEIAVSDAMGKVSNGKILLDVKPEGSTNPLTNADHVVTRAGESVTVSPLANDTSSGREQLRLARVEDTPGAEIDRDYANRKFTFKATTPDTYYVQYLATAGPKPAKGIVRVDVLDKQESELAPVAVRDVAMLTTGSEALVGVLGNDSDPAGGVLVVQSVSVPPSSGVNVSVLNHETLRISDQGSLDEPVRITYRISNGKKSAEGDVVVIPIPAPTKLLAPVTSDDEAVVRVGDVVTIPVLDNDVHPSGDKLHVAPDLVEPLVDPEDGEAFVSQDAVRFRAGKNPGTVYITYEAVDSRGQKAGGHIAVQVLPIDEDGTNAAPRPRDLTARALSGSRINIPVPLDGLDADGDSVELIGVDSAPAKGRIVEQGSNFLTYEAYEDAAGVDAFSYRVRDRLGAEAKATIRMGIAPPEAVNQAPYAVNDSVVVRPGRSVAVPALANDSDPEGDRIGYVKSGLTLPSDVKDMTAKISGDRIIIDVPDEELDTSLQYTISDDKGAQATAAIFVKVDEDVPLMNPIARDDRVQVEDVKDDLGRPRHPPQRRGPRRHDRGCRADRRGRRARARRRQGAGDGGRGAPADPLCDHGSGRAVGLGVHLRAGDRRDAPPAEVDQAARGEERRDEGDPPRQVRRGRRRRRCAAHRGLEGQRLVRERRRPDQGHDDPRLHLAGSLLRRGRTDVRGDRRRRPGRPRGAQVHSDHPDHRAAARQPAADADECADADRAGREGDCARPVRACDRPRPEGPGQPALLGRLAAGQGHQRTRRRHDAVRRDRTGHPEGHHGHHPDLGHRRHHRTGGRHGAGHGHGIHSLPRRRQPRLGRRGRSGRDDHRPCPGQRHQPVRRRGHTAEAAHR